MQKTSVSSLATSSMPTNKSKPEITTYTNWTPHQERTSLTRLTSPEDWETAYQMQPPTLCTASTSTASFRVAKSDRVLSAIPLGMTYIHLLMPFITCEKLSFLERKGSNGFNANFEQ